MVVSAPAHGQRARLTAISFDGLRSRCTLGVCHDVVALFNEFRFWPNCRGAGCGASFMTWRQADNLNRTTSAAISYVDLLPQHERRVGRSLDGGAAPDEAVLLRGRVPLTHLVHAHRSPMVIRPYVRTCFSAPSPRCAAPGRARPPGGPGVRRGRGRGGRGTGHTAHGALQRRGQPPFRLFEDDVGKRLGPAVLRHCSARRRTSAATAWAWPVFASEERRRCRCISGSRLRAQAETEGLAIGCFGAGTGAAATPWAAAKPVHREHGSCAPHTHSRMAPPSHGSFAHRPRRL